MWQNSAQRLLVEYVCVENQPMPPSADFAPAGE
jgi:hypothetical protein